MSIDTTKVVVAEAALAAGADLLNDVWGTGSDPGLAELAASAGVPLLVMHNRAEARYDDVVREVVDDLRGALSGPSRPASRASDLIVDPGIGFGKTADHNVAVLRHLGALRSLRRPILLGTSRKSTLGRILDLPPEDRLEAHARDHCPGDRGGHRYRPCPRRPGERPGRARQRCHRPRSMAERTGGRPSLSDRIVLANMQFEGKHGYHDWELQTAQPFEIDVELVMNLQPAGIDDDLTKTVDYGRVYEIARQVVEVDLVPIARGDRRGDQPRGAHRIRRAGGRRPGAQTEGQAGWTARPRVGRDLAPPFRRADDSAARLGPLTRAGRSVPSG